MQPKLPKSTANDTLRANEEGFATDARAEPIPFGWGEMSVSARWATPIYGQHATKGSTDKKKGGKSAEYFGTLMFEFACDGVDEIGAIYNSGHMVWSGTLLRASSTNPVRIQLEGMGPADVYWGITGQAQSTTLAQYETHPDYANVVRIELIDVSFGKSGETMAPNLTIKTRRSPKQSIITGGPSAIDGHFTAVAITIAAEIFTSWNWARRPVSELDAPSFQAVANAQLAETVPGTNHVQASSAPLYTKQVKIRQALADLCDVGLMWFRRGSDGKIYAGRWLRNASGINATAFGFEDLEKTPRGATGDIDEVYNEIIVKYRVAADMHKTDSVRVPNQAAINRNNGVVRSKTIERLDLLDADMARRFGREQLRREIVPNVIPFVVRREKCRNPNGTRIRPGDYFYAPVSKPGEPVVQALFRCMKRSMPEFGPITLEGEMDITVAPHPTTVNSPEQLIIPTIPGPVTMRRIISLPPKLITDNVSVCAFVARPSPLAALCDVKYGTSSSGDFKDIGRVEFALPLHLNASASAAAGTIRVKLTGNALYDRDAKMLTTWTGGSIEGRDDSRLMVLVRKSGAGNSDIAVVPGSNLDWVEVVSINGPPALVSSGVYDVPVLRGRLGTKALDFNAGSFPDSWTNYEIWLLDGEDLKYLEHADFNGLVNTTTDAYFRFAAVSHRGTYTPQGAWDERTALAGAGISVGEYADQPDATTWVGTSTFEFPITFFTAPATPTGMTAVNGAGSLVVVECDPISIAQVNEIYVYVGTGPTYADEALHSQIPNPGGGARPKFFHVNGTPGVTYGYRFVAMAVNDVPSGYSVRVTCVPNAPTGPAPSSPGQASLNGALGTYLSNDANVMAYAVINMPGLPANATLVNLLMSTTNDVDKAMIVAYTTAGSATTVQIDDLTPTKTYYFWTQGGGPGGLSPRVQGASNVFPMTAPSKTGAPNNPSGFAAFAPSSSHPVPPQVWANGVQLYGGTVTFTPSTSPDCVGFQWVVSASNTFTPSFSNAAFCPATESEFFVYLNTLVPAFLWVRAKDSSGNFATPLMTGINMNGYVAIPAGTMISQQDTDSHITGVKIGSGGAPSELVAHFVKWHVEVLTIGQTYFDINISGYGFTARPDVGSIKCVTPVDEMGAVYDDEDAASTSTNARIKLKTAAGSTGPRRFHVILEEYF